ncbi:TIGR03621 family F420-dependent LLM class oxidoreductase [Myxococcota bacterium]|nr:TIGR03621 family F420-dependent LLM class oxidoreductase [Myxococcota bacterium]
MPRPFRFGVQISSLPHEDWRGALRRLESAGFSTVFLPDHFSGQWDPLTTLAGAAGVTESLKLGSLVCDVDFRHPAVLAKMAATIQVISAGRLELGLGAGWMHDDYDRSGIDFDPIGTRIDRLEEALAILMSLWENETTDYAGSHYVIRGMQRTVDLGDLPRPRLLVGGGGPRILGLAGQYADIVGINPTMKEGRITGDTARDLTSDRVRQKIEWIQAGAERSGRTLEDIELNSLVFVVALTDDPGPIREGLGKAFGMTPRDVAETPLALTGSGQEIRDRLCLRREQTGMSYIVIQGGDDAILSRFSEEVIQPLAGQ